MSDRKTTNVRAFVTDGTKVRDILGDTLNRADEWDLVIVLTRTTDGDYGIAHSDGDLSEKVCMSALAQHKFVEEMKE